MNNRKLKELVRFIPGVNQSRMGEKFENKIIVYYSQSDFELDFYFENSVNKRKISNFSFTKLSLKKGDVIISNTRQLAAMVSEENANKVLPMNFTKIDFLNDYLDKQYFLFLFNSYKEILHQKEREIQGNGPIQKIPLRSLGQFSIPYLDLAQQKLIGKAYVEMLQIQKKLKTISNLTEMLTYEILEKSIMEAKYHDEE